LLIALTHQSSQTPVLWTVLIVLSLSQGTAQRDSQPQNELRVNIMAAGTPSVELDGDT
jgi:hypothetical protein